MNKYSAMNNNNKQNRIKKKNVYFQLNLKFVILIRSKLPVAAATLEARHIWAQRYICLLF